MEVDGVPQRPILWPFFSPLILALYCKQNFKFNKNLSLSLSLSTQPVKLPLSKDMGQTLTAAIVPSHLAAVAAAAAGFPLRASHNPSLFQTQSLPTTLLRPAPGPIRTSHAPVLFAPYWPPNCDFGLNLTHHLSVNLIVVRSSVDYCLFLSIITQIIRYGSDVW